MIIYQTPLSVKLSLFLFEVSHDSSKHKFMPAFQNAILALDSQALDIDQVENLIKFCPTKEEMETLKVLCLSSRFFDAFLVW